METEGAGKERGGEYKEGKETDGSEGSKRREERGGKRKGGEMDVTHFAFRILAALCWRSQLSVDLGPAVPRAG